MESTAVKERPIIFSGPLVRAILEGRKTQTRRVVKDAPQSHVASVSVGDLLNPGEFGVWFNCRGSLPVDENNYSTCILCPYGQPGDRMWVRETWQPAKFESGEPTTIYKADFDRHGTSHAYPRWRSPATMPRWASRLTLEITDVRVQRLSEISTDDVNAEGVACSDCWTSGTAYKDFPHNEQCGCVNKFRNLWNSENTKSGDTWDANPWVFAITFKRY